MGGFLAIMFVGILHNLPENVRQGILRIARTRKGGISEVSELHLTIGRRSSLKIGRERIFIGADVSSADMEDVVYRLCGGAI